MCGIAAVAGAGWSRRLLGEMVAVQHHRGPDGRGLYEDPEGRAALGHTRLAILDLSDAGLQPMSSADGRYHLVFNGEIYNYLELRAALGDGETFRSATDSEVLLAAFARWGAGCLERLVGMFAFAVWDEHAKELFAARDRFGVKPLYYHQRPDGGLLLASEIKALHAGGVPRAADPRAWATYLTAGILDHSPRTFWEGIRALPAGHTLVWREGAVRIRRWYDLAGRVGTDLDQRPAAAAREEYAARMAESVRLRFRSDVPVGINLSGGLDSSVLLGLVQRVQGKDSDVKAFTFVTGDERYDELPWVRRMLERTRHPSVVCALRPEEVPALAESVHECQDEPFGGLPTLAYARLFEVARDHGVVVLLDGQGLDEQWCGYDYYAEPERASRTVVQATREPATRADCLLPELAGQADGFEPPVPFPDPLRNLQYRDICLTKIPRALRFNDRVSMRCSRELREPFLDHRLVELALRQPARRKIWGATHKRMLRTLARPLAPSGLVEAPKRPLQTPQREWLRGPLRGWADDLIERALVRHGGVWLDAAAVRRHWRRFQAGRSDNSFYVWQWLGMGMGRG